MQCYQIPRATLSKEFQHRGKCVVCLARVTTKTRKGKGKSHFVDFDFVNINFYLLVKTGVILMLKWWWNSRQTSLWMHLRSCIETCFCSVLMRLPTRRNQGSSSARLCSRIPTPKPFTYPRISCSANAATSTFQARFDTAGQSEMFAMRQSIEKLRFIYVWSWKGRDI